MPENQQDATPLQPRREVEKLATETRSGCPTVLVPILRWSQQCGTSVFIGQLHCQHTHTRLDVLPDHHPPPSPQVWLSLKLRINFVACLRRFMSVRREFVRVSRATRTSVSIHLQLVYYPLFVQSPPLSGRTGRRISCLCLECLCFFYDLACSYFGSSYK